MTSYSYECNTISVRHNALHYLALIIMNIRHEHNMFHVCALSNIYIVVYQHTHAIKYAYRKIVFSYIFRSFLLPSSGFLCKNAGKTLHNTAISQYLNIPNSPCAQLIFTVTLSDSICAICAILPLFRCSCAAH